MRICWPNRAKVAMTRAATATACQAARLRSLALAVAVMARKTGTVPTGSVITRRVTNVLARKNVLIIGVGEAGRRGLDDSMRRAPREAGQPCSDAAGVRSGHGAAGRWLASQVSS